MARNGWRHHLAGLVACPVILFSGALHGQGVADASGFPTKPMRLIVPFAPGGTTDLVARLIGQKLQESTSQPVLIDNRPGAGTNIGAQMVARAGPDGYTLLMGTPSIAVNPYLFEKMPYDVLKDLVPVTNVAAVPNILVVHPSMPVNSVSEFIAYAKARPGQLNFGSSSVGGAIHLSGELFNLMAGAQTIHIPFKGSAPALADLMAGRLQFMFDNLPSALPQVKAGKLRALAVTSAARVGLVPDLPTMSEAGLKSFEVLSWNGLLVPAATPRAIVLQLNRDAVKAIRSADANERMVSLGIIPIGDSPEAFGKFIRAEMSRWSKVIRTAGIKLE